MKILILGGYGNFGTRIAYALAKANCAIIIAGRNLDKAKVLQQRIKQQYADAQIEIAAIDINQNFNHALQRLQPRIVINTCGPF